MGTYTANYQLYMPSIGEQGWGDLMNGNLTTIDTTMKSLNTRMGTAENNITSLDSRLDTVETYGSRITAIENEVNGNLSCTNVTATNTLTANKIVVPMNNSGHITLYSMNISAECTKNTGLVTSPTGVFNNAGTIHVTGTYPVNIYGTAVYCTGTIKVYINGSLVIDKAMSSTGDDNSQILIGTQYLAPGDEIYGTTRSDNNRVRVRIVGNVNI